MTIIGGISGALRMLAAGTMVALVGFVYVTLWTIPAAKEEGRKGYVTEVRATSAEALATELQRQISSQQTVIDAYQIQYKNALATQAAQDAETEKAIALNDQKRATAGRSCPGLDRDDLLFLQQ